MSTPSTATATIPQPHSHYGYSHYQGFQPNGHGYNRTNSLLGGPSRIGNSQPKAFPSNNTPSNPRTTEQSRQEPLHRPAMTTSQSSSALQDSRPRERQPNWNEFYKHGIPKEVIVIDDDDDEEGSHSGQQAHQPRPNHTTRTTVGSGNPQHANKKRKMGASSAYDPIYQQQPPYSTTQTPYYADSVSTSTNSSDRTTSALNTTAATSLGSHGSGGSHYDYQQQLDDGVVGQKRKRTRKAVADEAKRKEIEVQGDAYSSYHPPPKPPIKAKDVFVQVAQDVSFNTIFSSLEQSY